MLRALSLAALLLMMAGLFWLLSRGELFGREPMAIAVQVAACLLMIWARMTFGTRSFHAVANPTAGGLVTTGPYAFIRHPIYAAILYFIWAAAIEYHTPQAFGSAVMVTFGAIVRMLSEEHLLVGMYPEYRAYSGRTRRVVPYIL